MIDHKQQARLDQLRSEWREETDASREFSHLADKCRQSRQFSIEANARAVQLLEALERVAHEKADKIKADLRAAEGWQSVR